MGIVVTRGKSFQDHMVKIIHKCAANNGVSSFNDLAVFGVNPTIRQKQIVGRSDGDFLTSWARQFVGDKFGAATTHWDKLESRIDRGVGNPCPLLLIGIPRSTIVRSTGDQK